MNKSSFQAGLLLALCSCKPSPPNEIHSYKAGNGVDYISAETRYGIGPISSDYTKIYYVYQRDKAIRKVFIVGGDYLSIGRIFEGEKEGFTLCAAQGKFNGDDKIIDAYRYGRNDKIKFYFQYKC